MTANAASIAPTGVSLRAFWLRVRICVACARDEEPGRPFLSGTKTSEPGKLRSVLLFVQTQGAASVILVVAPDPAPGECKLAQAGVVGACMTPLLSIGGLPGALG